MRYQWDFAVLSDYVPLLLKGLANTLILGAVVLVVGLVCGLAVAMARCSGYRTLRLPAVCFVELFRNIPPLLLLFWFFYAIPVLTGWQSSPFVAAAVAVSLYNTAYMSEVFRSGIQSVEKGLVDAAKAIGMSYWGVMRWVVVAVAIRRVVPALTNQAIEGVKATALASTIAYAELLHSAKVISDAELRPLEAFTVMAAIFIGLLLVLSWISMLVERRFARSR